MYMKNTKVLRLHSKKKCLFACFVYKQKLTGETKEDIKAQKKI